ncbi:MAG: alkaline phosphatase D family protein [Myxococcota bacterium]|nr:alkaline phosphatase D family protein [Myxococcota bacterium]
MLRRELLRGVVGAMAGTWLGACGADGRSPTWGRFRRGVATGDPRADAVVFWTHLAEAVGDEPLRLLVATDEALRDVVASRELVAFESAGHTVRAEVDGLPPGRTLYYAFETVRGERSAVGRTRTAGEGEVPSVRLAVLSCASYAHGFFHVYRNVSQVTNLDAVLHLGDFIYEVADGFYGSLRAYDPPHECRSLDDYRRRHAHYRLDPDLVALLGMHPLVATWDDHEHANDAWPGGSPWHDEATEGPWAERLRASTRAYAEWMPLGSVEPLWRSLRFGDLVELFVLDTRLQRDRPPADEREARAPGRSMLGEGQRRWLFEGLRASRARWKLVAGAVQFSPHPEFWNLDAWDGWAVERDALLELVASERIEGVVFLCGDGHKSFAQDVPLDRRTYDPATGRGSVAVELMTPAVSSPNLFGAEARAFEAMVRAASPETKFVDAEHRGWLWLEITPERLLAEHRFVEDVERPDGGRERVAARFEVRHGEPWLRRTGP